MIKKDDRPPIPSEMSREIRQRCGFGCVICGRPFYEYDHMVAWADEKRHVAAEITLLCKEHHTAKTSKRLPEKDVIEANKNPFNLRKGNSTADILYFSGNKVIVIIGTNIFTSENVVNRFVMTPILVNTTPIITIKLEDNHFLLDINLFDENNKPILIVKDNLIEYTVGVWDVECVGRNIVIREASRKIFIDIDFLTPDTIRFNRGTFYCEGNLFEIKKSELTINTFKHYSGISAKQIPIGVYIGKEHPSSACGFAIFL